MYPQFAELLKSHSFWGKALPWSFSLLTPETFEYAPLSSELKFVRICKGKGSGNERDKVGRQS
jgi:hypothetical protein